MESVPCDVAIRHRIKVSHQNLHSFRATLNLWSSERRFVPAWTIVARRRNRSEMEYHIQTSLALSILAHFWIKNWSHIATHLVVVLLLVVRATLFKKPKAPLFQTDRDEIWQDCSSSKYALIVMIDGNKFLIRRDAFKMADMTSGRRSLCHMQQRPQAARSPAECVWRQRHWLYGYALQFLIIVHS